MAVTALITIALKQSKLTLVTTTKQVGFWHCSYACIALLKVLLHRCVSVQMLSVLRITSQAHLSVRDQTTDCSCQASAMAVVAHVQGLCAIASQPATPKRKQVRCS